MERPEAGACSDAPAGAAMKRRIVFATALAAALTIRTGAGAAPPAPTTPADHSGLERYHYSLNARVRPLVVFWISRANVGDAFATRSRGPQGASYSLLIGSDPERAPLHINRWGYIEEEIRGAEARLVGLMTESDEDSPEQAEASVRRQGAGRHAFKFIEGTANQGESQSRVASIAAPEDYTLRQLRTVLDLGRDSRDWKARTVRLPPEARPGFLTALAESMHAASAGPITYVYYGRLYELRRTHSEAVSNIRIGSTSYGSAIAADYLVTSLYDGERTRFSMTYGTRAPFAEVPLRVMYQPRWWLEVELTIHDDGSRIADGVVR
jgi:hypothetical protein